MSGEFLKYVLNARIYRIKLYLTIYSSFLIYLCFILVFENNFSIYSAIYFNIILFTGVFWLGWYRLIQINIQTLCEEINGIFK